MKRFLMCITIGGAVLAGTRATMADSTDSSKITKRQMIVQVVDCVKKRASSDKTVSYREAIKACKNQVKEQNAASSDALLASGTPAIP